MLNIAVVTETYPPEINGVAKSLSQMIGGLLGRGHRIRLFRPRQNYGDQSQRQGLLEQITLPGLRIPLYKDLRFGLPLKQRLMREWRHRRPDVVQVVTEGPLGWAAVRAARALRLPVVSDFRTNFDAYSSHYGLGPAKRLVEHYLRALHNDTACTLVPTREMATRLLASGYQRLEVVGRGVDTQLFHPQKRDEHLRASWGLAPDDLGIVHVGRIAREKNIKLAVDAFTAIREQQPLAKLILVGDGPERIHLEAKHPDIIFAGMQKGEDLARHYASGDVFLFPSITETFGNVVLEAMSSGLALVAYDYAAAKEHLLTQHSAAIVPFDDADAFIHAAQQLVDQPETIQQYRTQARRLAEHCSWDRVYSDLEKVLVAHTVS